MNLTRRVSEIQPSQTLAITALVETMRREGKKIIALGAGEPDFDTPQPIKDAAIKAIADGATKYTPISGTIELKEAICEKYMRDQGVKYAPSEVLVSCGAKHALANALLALCQKGDEVIIPVPYWTSYIELVRFVGATPVLINTDESTGFKVSKDQLEQAISPRTKVFLLNSPSNPTGATYSHKELEALASVVSAHDFCLIFDEIYEKILYDGLKHASLSSFASLRDRLILINGVSKSYAMTGWRIGYLLAPDFVVKACNKIQSHTTSNPSSISQAASVAAIRSDDSIFSEMLRAFNERRTFLVSQLQDMPGIECELPSGAFYVFPNIAAYFGRTSSQGKIESAMDFCAYMLQEANVAMVPGEAFGSKNHVRLSYATSMHVLEEAVVAMRKALLKL